MSDKIALFTGSFDPITLGHVELIARASHLFDKLYVGLFYNREKEGFFSIEAKERMVRAALAHLENVEVIVSQGELAVAVARRLGATTIVRGLRNATDLDYETNLQFYNRDLAPEVDTVYLVSGMAYQQVSSTRVRELIAFGQDIRAYVPMSVVEEVERLDDRDKED